MTIDDITALIASDESRIQELKKTTGELKDGTLAACAFLNAALGKRFVTIIIRLIKDMLLPINVEDLLRQRKVESNRIEFKKGWNPNGIYRSICTFSNDFDNMGMFISLLGLK